MTVYAQQRSSSCLDSYFNILNPAEQNTFAGFENFIQDTTDLAAGNGNLVRIFVALDSSQVQYSRSVYSFLSFTGDLGGVFQILEIIGTVIVSVFVNRLFYYSVLSKIYQIDQPEGIANTNNIAVSPLQDQTAVDDNSRVNELNKKSVFENNQDGLNILAKAIKAIRNRKAYNFRFFDLFYNLFYPLKCVTCGVKCWIRQSSRYNYYK